MTSSPQQHFLDVLDDIFFGFDSAGNAVVWNESAEHVTGYTGEEISTMAVTDFFSSEDEEAILQSAKEVSENEEAQVEAKLLTKDGELIPYEFKTRHMPGDHPAHIVGIGRDVTERYKQRAQIERRERVLKEMYEIIADQSLSFDEQVTALLKLGRKELGTEFGTLSKIDGDDYIIEVIDTEKDTISEGDVFPLSETNCEVTAKTKQTLVLGDIERDAKELTSKAGFTEFGVSCYIGAPVFLNESVYGTFCFYDTEPLDGQFMEWEVTLVDLMSRWVSYELQRKHTKDELQRQNDRLEGFASVVSHDLRSPLNVVSGSIELTQDTGDIEHLTRAQSSLTRVNTLIEDLLTLARAGDIIGDTVSVELEKLVSACWENVDQSEATLNNTLTQSVTADKTRLQQVFENLFRNAVEHTSGHVTITVGDLEDGFYVEDDGSGIPADEQSKVFESGYTTISDGTGFGLAIVSEIVSAHGWELSLSDSEDGGARFEITF